MLHNLTCAGLLASPEVNFSLKVVVGALQPDSPGAHLELTTGFILPYREGESTYGEL